MEEDSITESEEKVNRKSVYFVSFSRIFYHSLPKEKYLHSLSIVCLTKFVTIIFVSDYHRIMSSSIMRNSREK